MKKTFKSIQSFSLDKTKNYFSFIEMCEKEIIPENVYTEIHHIVPLSHGGTNISENLIRLTYENHIKAHKFIFEITDNLVDSFVLNMMCGQTEETRRIFRQLGAYASHNKQRQRNHNMFNVEFQKKMAQRSLISEKSKKARKKVGRNLGWKRQKNRIIKYDEKFLLTRNHKPILCITRCNTGQEIGRLIASIDPVVSTVLIKSQLRMTRIIKDPTKSLYKWRCKRLHINLKIVHNSNTDNPQPSQEWVKILYNSRRISFQFLGRFRD